MSDPQLVQITEYLAVNTEARRWQCARCEADLGPTSKPYKHGLLLYDRDPSEIFEPKLEGEYTFAPDPAWCRIVEFYCPGCGTQVETEYLPPGHPISHDIDLDIDRLAQMAQVDARPGDEK
jgi:acetone carboxylase gamma subunit